MKNIISLVTPGEVNDFVYNLWKSDIFRYEHRNGGFVARHVNRFSWLPRLFAESSNDYLERAHFSTWWNVIMLRHDYENPIIHDLYYLHEMTHAATMPYISGIGREAFDEKMRRNELEASVLSEIAVYFEIEGLRETSFDHEIYADRFLDDPDMRALWKANPLVAEETLRAKRYDVMVSKPEHLMDISEVWIRRFADQNAVYSAIWADRYKEIEAKMSNFQINASDNRAGALSTYREWLEQEAARDASDNIPFRIEAELFAPFYWSNKAKYTNAMKDQ